MTTNRFITALAIPWILCAAFLWIQHNPSSALQPGKKQVGTEIIQEFPTKSDKKRTAWKVRWRTVSPGYGLAITGAWFRKSADSDWLKVLGGLRLSEIFVPYNNSTRIYDIGSRGQFKLVPPTPGDLGASGAIIGGLAVKELRNTGLQYKFYNRVRRGEALVLWGALGAGNYNYIMEYTFHDEGSITCRLGATGQNFGGHYTMPHMHHGCWRIDVDLGDADHNSVKLIRRFEPVPASVRRPRETAREYAQDFNNGVNGGAYWIAKEFNTLRVFSTKHTNGHKHPVSYDLVPMIRPGTPRHLLRGEEFTHFDFWVTPFNWKEQYYTQLPLYIKRNPRRNIKDTNVVIWYQAPMHHIPRDEDGIYPMNAKGRPVRQGVTLVMWGGFKLRPRNVFDSTPYYP